MVGDTPRAEDPMVITSFRVAKSWLDILESNGDKIGEFARAGIKARVDYITGGGLEALEDKIRENKLIMEDLELQQSILERQKELMIQQSISAAQEATEKDKKLNKFISEIQRLAPAIIENHDGTARYKIEHLAGLSPGPGRADIARFFQGRRELPEVGEIREFLKIE